MTIGVDELEAVRLADMEGLYQEAAAERMRGSRTTSTTVTAGSEGDGPGPTTGTR